jgi:hypothetical protein
LRTATGGGHRAIHEASGNLERPLLKPTDLAGQGRPGGLESFHFP